MTASVALLFFLISLSVYSPPPTLASPTTFFHAVEVLEASGYHSMALTLELTHQILNLESLVSTIFAPWDAAFANSTQLSVLELQYHMSPIALSKEDLNALSFGTRIPTLLPNRSLIVTTSSSNHFSINGVLLQESELVDNGSVVIHGITQFFDPSFEFHHNLAPESSPPPISDNDHFSQASNVLRSKGYSIMATFLDAQLFWPENQPRLTVFAPIDVAMNDYTTNVSEYGLIFRRHMAPGLFSWQDLVRFSGGESLATFSDKFMINVTRTGDDGAVVLNGIPVVMLPDMYSSHWLIVHGLNQLLMSTLQQVSGDDIENNGADTSNRPDYGDYGNGATP